MDRAKADPSERDDPWDLPPFFFLRDNKWRNPRTYSGYWKEKEEELTAIRSAGESSSSSSPSYVGVRKTLEFYLKDGTSGGEGTKTDWILHEYHHLRKGHDDDDHGLILQDDVVLRKVLNKRCKNKSDPASSLYRQVESCVKAYNELKVHCSPCDIIPETEESDIPNIAHYKDGTSSFMETKTDIILPSEVPNNTALCENIIYDILYQSLSLHEVKSRENLIRSYHTTLSKKVNREELRQCLKKLRIKILGFRDVWAASSWLAHQRQIASGKVVITSWLEWQRHICSVNVIRAFAYNTVRGEGLNEALELLNTLEVLNEVLGVDCDPHGQPIKVWEHFTKIRSTNDPDEVYAACHRCDKVFKAHPKKHGTSHLKRHIRTCSSSGCTNPSTDEDREMLRRLRTVLEDPNEQQKMDCHEDLTQLDPWDPKLTFPNPWYVTRSTSRQTKGGGEWKEINNGFTAIRMDQQGCWEDIDKEIAVIQTVPVPQPQYMGLRRTLQFHLPDDRKVDWIMLEYQQLDVIESPVLLLQGATVIRKVFCYDKDEVDSTLSELKRFLNADDDNEEEYINGEGVNTDINIPSDNMDATPSSVFLFDEGMDTDTTTPSTSDSMDTVIDRKRKRAGAASRDKSKLWMHFTKIKNADCGLVYVVCHSCDRGYSSGRSTNGTSHLWRHNKSCTSKRRRTENANDASTEWEAEIWPLFLVFKNYGETEQQGCAEGRSQ